MLFARGTKVRLKATGDVGEVVDLDADDLVWVLLEDGEEIPVYSDALLPYTGSVIKESPSSAVDKGPPENPLYTTLGQGVFIAFDPVYGPDDIPEYYQILLLNDTSKKVQYQFKMMLEEDIIYDLSHLIPEAKSHYLGRLEYDELSEHPKMEIQLQKTGVGSIDGVWSKMLRIKVKTFFKNQQNVEQLDREGILFFLTDSIQSKDQSSDDLKTYTKLNHTPKPKYRSGYVPVHASKEFAAFSTEIDLHIEHLTPLYANMRAGEKLRIQLKAFDAYLAKAIRLGVDRVFIIHGLGKGRLRDEIAKRLIQHPQVKTFKNEHHPRYGFGATEVIF